MRRVRSTPVHRLTVVGELVQDDPDRAPRTFERALDLPLDGGGVAFLSLVDEADAAELELDLQASVQTDGTLAVTAALAVRGAGDPGAIQAWSTAMRPNSWAAFTLAAGGIRAAGSITYHAPAPPALRRSRAGAIVLP